MKDFLRKFAAYIVAAILFVAIGCIYCAPSLKGKVVLAGDTSSGAAASHELAEFHAKTGEYSFWTGSQFSGMPSFQVGGYHYKADTLLSPLKKILLSGWGSAPLILITYFICFFIFLRSFGVDEWLSIVGALAIGFSSYFLTIIPAGHLYKTATIPLLAVVAGGFKLIFDGKYSLGAVLVMIPTAVCFTIHPQMSYYMCMMIGLFFLAEIALSVRRRSYRKLAVATAVFAGALLLGIGAQSASVFANKEYAGQTMRGGHSDLTESPSEGGSKGLDIAYATQWSYGWGESFSFLIPGVRGGSSNYNVGKDSDLFKSLVKKGIDRRSAAGFCENVPLYWGDQPFTSGNVYMGAIVCFLFVLGLILVRGPYKWALLAATLFSMLLALGSNFMPLTEFFFKHFPMYNKFRAVSSILIVAEITMPLLGFLGLKEIFSGAVEKGRAVRATLLSAGITGGLCLFFALFGGLVYDFTSPGDAAWAGQLPDFVYAGILGERAALLRSDSWRSLIFIVVSALSLWLYLKGKIGRALLIGALGVLMVADLWPVNRRYFNDSNFVSPKSSAAQFDMQPYEKAILADRDPHFRVLNLTTNTFNDARTSYYLKHIGGYSAAKLRRYQDLIDEHISKSNMSVLNMLNAKYIIVPGENGEPSPVLNEGALGNAWFVSGTVIADTPKAESDSLKTLDLSKTAVVGRDFEEFATCATDDPAAEVRLTSYSPKALSYECSSEKGGTIVFSEIYYPFGWKVAIDGSPAGHFRADYTLRALNVPAGKHEISFVFDPDSVKKGDTMSVICIILIYLLTALVAVLGVFRRKR